MVPPKMLRLQSLTAFLVFILSVTAQINSQELKRGSGKSGSPEKKGVLAPVPPTQPQPASTITSAPPPPSSTDSVDISSLLASLSSALTTSSRSSEVDVSSPLASLSSDLSVSLTASPTSISKTSTSTSQSPTLTGSTLPTSTTTMLTSDPSTTSTDHNTLVIVLAVVFALLGLTLLIIAFFLIRRYRRGQKPFSRFARRGATPIDDDEIATWRGNSGDMVQPTNYHHRTTSSIVFSHTPGWTWTVQSSPSSTRSGGEALSTPPVLARAPNARSGLTDQAVPGADPFVTPLKRQSTRLSKQPSGHTRNKSSRRSSVSVSLADRPATLGNVEDETFQRHMRGDSKGSRSRGRSGSTPPASLVDGRPGLSHLVSPSLKHGQRNISSAEDARVFS